MQNSDCIKLKEINLNDKFILDKVTDMSYMFNNCNSLLQLDVSKFITTNVQDMSYMFQGCNLLSSLSLSNFNADNVEIWNICSQIAPF